MQTPLPLWAAKWRPISILHPGTHETWAPHTATGYYLGSSHEHYQCHKIYICDTRHTRVCDTVFFKHKYLTMPAITPADALITAADKLVDAISGVIPKNSITEDAVLQLMSIYRKQALEASDAASAQRVLRRLAESQRAQAETDVSEEQRVETPQASTEPDLGILRSNIPSTPPQSRPMTQRETQIP